jgi:O-antigen ligase
LDQFALGRVYATGVSLPNKGIDDMLNAFLFGLAVCLCALTSLRGQSSFGPLDVLVVVLALSSLMMPLKTNLIEVHPIAPMSYSFPTLWERWRNNPVAIFWLFTIPLFAASVLINLQGGRLQNVDLFKVAAPFAGTAVVSLAAADIYMSRLRKPFVLGFIIGTFAIFLIYVAAIVSNFSPLYNTDGRFIGLSANPNQTGFQAIATIAICTIARFHLFESSRIARIIIDVCILCSIIIGLASQSDSFILSIAPILAYGGLRGAQILIRDKIAGVLVAMLAAAIGITALLIFRADAVTSAKDSFLYNLEYGNQDVDRITVWRNGLSAWRENPIFGHGPGAWSGFSGPFEGIEAHNSYIDWLTILGSIGFLFYFFLILNIIRFNPLKESFRYVALGSILIFGMFGFFMRFPIYWISMMIILVSFEPRGEPGVKVWERANPKQN